MALKKRYLTMLFLTLAYALPACAQNASKDRLQDLQSEMYRLFYTNDSLKLRETIEQLKKACQETGNEQLFYRAWANNAIYESLHQRRTHGLEICREIEKYAKGQESIYGQYAALHTFGTVYHQMRDYENAEKNFKDAADFLHKHMPEESAAADYIELVLLSVNGYRDVAKGMAYAEKALQEPNISAQHRLRALTMLCQMEGEKVNPNREVFNGYYHERQLVLQGTVPDRANNAVNMLYELVNGNYDRAMVLSDSLSTIDQRIYAKARIYHLTGDNDRAYEMMLLHKSVTDSINQAERNGLLSEYIVQLNNERLELKNKELEEQNETLRNRLIYTVIAMFVIFLTMGSYHVVKRLRKHNALLDKAHKEEMEARLAEEEIRKQVEKELDVKREFLSNIAQELRTPLNPITGFSDILATPNFELGEEERQMMSEHIKENSKLLTGIIDNMIELSLYESKSSLPRTDVVSPNVIAQNAVDYGKTRVKPGVEIGLFSNISNQLTIMSDMTAVGNVLRRLVDNAAKYTERGGITINCYETAGTVKFTVTDTGPGVPPEKAGRIFDPITQSGTDVRSTGMGLAICLRIAKLLGGSLELDKNYKKGSRFVFEIPKA